MLIQLVFFIFMIVSITALYVDLGVARLTQTQMQNAADTAALEGLRQRDAGGGDSGRRAAARDMNTAALATLGEGPFIDFTDQGIAGPLAASQTYNAQASGVYTPPPLELNLNNDGNSDMVTDANGDMVSGTYGQPTPAFPDASCPPGNGAPVKEDCQYNRADFLAADPAASATAPSFLVRLRRTSDYQGLDSQTNVSSKGPTLPLLFGRATAIQAGTSNNPNNYNPRVDGISVRATAIADSRPALRVGLPAAGLPGVIAQFALQASYWRNLGDNVTDTLASDIFGNLVTNACTQGVFLDQSQPPPRIVGTPIAAVVGGSVPVGAGYVPLYDGTNRVIGFGYILVGGTVQSTCITAVGAAHTIQRISPHVATQNATAVLAGAVIVNGVPLSPAELSAVLAANACLADPPPGAQPTDCRVPRAGALMAPVVAR